MWKYRNVGTKRYKLRKRGEGGGEEEERGERGGEEEERGERGGEEEERKGERSYRIVTLPLQSSNSTNINAIMRRYK